MRQIAQLGEQQRGSLLVWHLAEIGEQLAQLFALLAILASILAVAVYIIRQLQALVASAARDPFIAVNAGRLRRIGWALVAVQLLALPLGLGYGAFIAGWNGLVGRVLPEANRAAAWGTVMAVEALGYAVGPVLGGLTWAAFGPPGVFALGAAVFLLTEAYYLWPGRTVTHATPTP